MSEVFTFVDASHLVSKVALWEERDELIKQKYDKINNDNISKVAHDNQAKIGCKGGSKFWYGYKKHVSVDMQSGLINQVALTPAIAIHKYTCVLYSKYYEIFIRHTLLSD